MQPIHLSPLQLYLRYYAAEVDSRSTDQGDVSHTAEQYAALNHLPAETLDALIAFIENALSTNNQSSLQKIFRDGHLNFRWRNPEAARKYLVSILSDAKKLRAL